MDDLKLLADIDYLTLLISLCVILAGLKYAVTLFEWVCGKLGIELRYVRKRNEEHNLLLSTTQGLKELSEKHDRDVEQSIAHDKKIQEELRACVQEIKNSISKTQETMDQFTQNRIHDREQSFIIQKELTDAQSKISESLNILSQKMDQMKLETDTRFRENESKQNKRVRAELKDKIGRSYRYYNSIKKINPMELEALEGLIAEYEAAQGENSFVHSVVLKEMYTWELIADKNEDE